MKSNKNEKERRVLIIGSDGLRYDCFDPEIMPTYSKLKSEGTLFTQYHSIYPPLTRACMTTLTTGVYPGRHGVVNNLIYVPGFGEEELLETGNHHHYFKYKEIFDENFVLAPSIGDRLHLRGLSFGVSMAGSPG